MLFEDPQELGLEPGQEVELRIRAYDNDTVSGSKAGDSRTIRVKVLSAGQYASDDASVARVEGRAVGHAC